MKEVTYAQLDQVLSSLGFSARVVTLENELAVIRRAEQRQVVFRRSGFSLTRTLRVVQLGVRLKSDLRRATA